MIRTSLIVLFAFVLACSSTPAKEPLAPTGSPEATTVSPEATTPEATTPEAPVPALEQLTITVKSRYLSWRAASNEVVFEEDSGVMKPAYRHFYFDQAEFEAKVGTEETIEGEPSVTIEVVEKSESAANPGDGASPEGGIAVTTYRCRIISVN